MNRCMEEQKDELTDRRKISPFYWTLSPIGAAAQKSPHSKGLCQGRWPKSCINVYFGITGTGMGIAASRKFVFAYNVYANEGC